MTPARSKRQGLLLVGHGTRDREGADEFACLLPAIRAQLPAVDVRAAYIELQTPGIAESLLAMAADGIDAVTVTPLLLFAAGHAKRDIPSEIGRARREAGGMLIQLADHLGCHPQLLALSRRRYDEAIGGLPAVPESETALILVGRGSGDSEAIAEMNDFVARRTQGCALRVHTAFLAMAEPAVESEFEVVRNLPQRRVVVQPHLMFEGALVKSLRRLVQQVGGDQMGQQWILTEPLRPAPELIAAVLERFAQAQ